MDKKFTISLIINIVLALLCTGAFYEWHKSSTSKCPPCVEIKTVETVRDTILYHNSTPVKIVASKVVSQKVKIKQVKQPDEVDLSSLIPDIKDSELNIVTRNFDNKRFKISITDSIKNNSIVAYNLLYSDFGSDTIKIYQKQITIERPASKVDFYGGVNLFVGSKNKGIVNGDVAPQLSCVIKGKYQVHAMYQIVNKEVGFGFSYKLFSIR